MSLLSVVLWEDGFSSIINLNTVTEPRKGLDQYMEGQEIRAPYQGKSYSAKIMKISMDRQCLKLYLNQFVKGEGMEKKEQKSESKAIKKPQPVEGKSQHKERSKDKATKRPTQEENKQGEVKRQHVDNSLDAKIISNDDLKMNTNSNKDALVTKKSGDEGSNDADLGLCPAIDAKEAVPGLMASPERARIQESKRVRLLEQEVRELKAAMKEVKEDVRYLMKKRHSKSESKTAGSMLLPRLPALPETTTTSTAASLPSVVTPRPTSVATPDEDTSILIQHLADSRQAVKVLAWKLFSQDEIINSSITGKKTFRSGETPRPPLDATKYQKMISALKIRYPTEKEKDFAEKFRNIQRMEREKKTKMLKSNI